MTLTIHRLPNPPAYSTESYDPVETTQREAHADREPSTFSSDAISDDDEAESPLLRTRPYYTPMSSKEPATASFRMMGVRASRHRPRGEDRLDRLYTRQKALVRDLETARDDKTRRRLEEEISRGYARLQDALEEDAEEISLRFKKSLGLPLSASLDDFDDPSVILARYGLALPDH